MRPWLPVLAILLLAGCLSPTRRMARDFVEADARSEAADIAREKCAGRTELIAGRKGLTYTDYRCIPEPVAAPPGNAA